MADFTDDVYSLPIDLFRALAPRLKKWEIVRPMLPCWRLWWNSNPGAFVRWQGRRIALGPDRFVLVAPETPFEVELRKPIARHVFIHFGLATNQWRLTNRVIEVAAERWTVDLCAHLLARLPRDMRTSVAEPLLSCALVTAVLSCIAKKTWPVTPADMRINRVVSAVEGSLSHGWSNEDMARLAALSVGGFTRRFRQLMGVAPQQHLLTQRLALARNLLLQTELSIEAITERCGFCDRSYFSTVFRREVGLPPAGFRHQNSPENAQS
jgi:AraC-like DNA-binding protein